MHSAALVAAGFALAGAVVAWVALPAQESRSTAKVPPFAQSSPAVS
jgi:hypothetical protein